MESGAFPLTKQQHFNQILCLCSSMDIIKMKYFIILINSFSKYKMDLPVIKLTTGGMWVKLDLKP